MVDNLFTPGVSWKELPAPNQNVFKLRERWYIQNVELPWVDQTWDVAQFKGSDTWSLIPYHYDPKGKDVRLRTVYPMQFDTREDAQLIAEMLLYASGATPRKLASPR